MLVAVLAGDGIGPEIVAEAVRVLEACRHTFELPIEFEPALVGGAAYDACGHPLPPETLALCKRASAVLLGAVGGPKWDGVQPVSMRPEVGALLPLRRELGLYANLRPVRLYRALAAASSLRTDLTNAGFDMLVVRELTGGIYFGARGRTDSGAAYDTCTYAVAEVERLLRLAFSAAQSRRRRLCSVDKANVLETSRLWRETANRVAADYPDVELEHMLVDNCAMQLLRNPAHFDVIATENMFGDILSDEAAMLTGSLGMLPSASLGAATGATAFGLYEPIHGSAPDIAGQGNANPLATILSGAMLLRHSLGQEEAAASIERAVHTALASGARTADIAAAGSTPVTTTQMADAVIAALAA